MKVKMIAAAAGIVLIFGIGVLTAVNAKPSSQKAEISGSQTAVSGEPNAIETDAEAWNEAIDEGDADAAREMEKEYKIYEPYGLTYDSKEGVFYYQGKKVRYFKDNMDDKGNLNGFSSNEGEIDLIGIRDEKYNLTGIRECSKEESQQLNEKFEQAQNEMSALADDTAHEEGNINRQDDTLAAYTSYGVSYNKKKDVWTYENQEIHFFSDGGRLVYIDHGVEKGVDLLVKRNSESKIEKIEILTEEEYKKLCP